MPESAVDRLLNKAEKAVDEGEYEKAFNYVNIAEAHTEVRRIELESLEAAMSGHDRAN